MANENQNPLSAYVESRIAAWQAVLASLKAAMALDPGGQVEGLDLSSVASNGGELGQPIDLPEGAFLGKSIPTCIKLYLSAVKKKKTVKEIATALREGGVETTAGNFESPVTTALNRLKAAGDVLRFKDGWGLSSWMPPHMRGAATPQGTQGKRSKGKKKGKKAKTKESSVAAAKSAPEKVTEIAKPEDKPEPRILGFLKKREASAGEIATALGLKIQTTHLVLGKLAHQHKIQKLDSGNFKIAG